MAKESSPSCFDNTRQVFTRECSERSTASSQNPADPFSTYRTNSFIKAIKEKIADPEVFAPGPWVERISSSNTPKKAVTDNNWWGTVKELEKEGMAR